MLPSYTARIVKRQITSQPIWRPVTDSGALAPKFLHITNASLAPRKKHFFSSNAQLRSENVGNTESVGSTSSAAPIKKGIRSVPPGKRSLRRGVVEAQRSREVRPEAVISEQGTDTITAICTAEEFDMDIVAQILKSHGFEIDPHDTGFLEQQVIHTRGRNNGDIFVFPSGTVVTWALPEAVAVDLATVTLLPAALRPHVNDVEMEDLEFREDPNRDVSSIHGDVITLGIKSSNQETNSAGLLDTTLAKIAFSSGLARSTKLGVLEALLSKYFESTRSIPILLSKGSRLPFNRQFMLQKTGQLLELRAQLNHYSELTDSLPDLFWDTRHELGLEGIYNQVGRALDIGVRIKALNEKMDYAQEISTILRQTLSEKHSIHLEWIIIILIAVEVAFGIRHIVKERKEELEARIDVQH